MSDFPIITTIATVGGAAITVGTLMTWYNRRIEARVVMERRVSHLERDFQSLSGNTDFLHGQQEKEIAELKLKVSELEHQKSNLYWMIKTILAKIEMSASSLGFDEIH